MYTITFLKCNNVTYKSGNKHYTHKDQAYNNR